MMKPVFYLKISKLTLTIHLFIKGNSPSKHRIFGKKFTQHKKWENFGKFGFFLVYRMYLNEKNIKMARKIRWSWSGECSKWHMFFSPKSDIFKHIHFSFGKTHQKNVKFAQLEDMYVFLRKNYKNLKSQIFVEQSSRANSTMFF
jgi:hypothetical protein